MLNIVPRIVANDPTMLVWLILSLDKYFVLIALHFRYVVIRKLLFIIKQHYSVAWYTAYAIPTTQRCLNVNLEVFGVLKIWKLVAVL